MIGEFPKLLRFYTSEEQALQIKLTAESKGISQATLVRQALDRYFAQEAQR